MSDPRDDLAALTDDDTRTWIGTPPVPDDIRTWDGLEAIIDANENWGSGHIIEQMKAAGWREPEERRPCLDCQANLDANGGRHMFHCQTPEGIAQWTEERLRYDRDDLAAIIGRNIPDGSDLKAADAVIAAGWRPPLKQHPPHDINMERAPYCTVCGRDVQWDDDAESWQH